MAYHENALDAIFEDGIYDAELEEGEMSEEQMDVDAEEGEFVVNDPPASAFLNEQAEAKSVHFGEFDFHQANGTGNRGIVMGDDGCPKSSLSRSSQKAGIGELGQHEDRGAPPRRKKPKKKRSGKKRAKSVNVAQFVRDTCNHLQEKKHPLMWAAVKELGIDGVSNLIKEVDVIERCGGQMTNDGKRRRTPGGVMWNILRGRVPPDVYKEIMSQGNEVQKQKEKKVKESLKRNRMDEDSSEPVNNKRQKLTPKEVDMSGSVGPRKQINSLGKSLRPAEALLDAIEGPQKDNSSLSAAHLQKAWVEGIRKKESVDEAAVVPVPSNDADLSFLKEGTMTAGLLEKKPVAVFERLRVPVEYSDLVTEEKPVPSSQIAPIKDIHPVDVSSDRGSQDPEHNGR